ncbi:MAG TPA: hypothetical protein VGQ31_14485 [Candidatus Limnocylindrales bacterium]|jgi:hypothetical protein|nr:hypothetical protein [Candidatus Limnocylindrales bacterium]
MRPLDLALAGAGRSHAALHRRARWLPALTVVALFLLSLLPVLIVGSTKQPNDVSLKDLQSENVPAGASWFRLRGDLRDVPAASPYTYTLHDLTDDSRAVTVVSDSPLPTGHIEITGRQDGPSQRGTFLSIQADVPTEPVRHDPWLLYAIPAVIAIVIVVGWLRGYPVKRRDGGTTAAVDQLHPGERLAATWGGWIASETHGLDAMSACQVEVACDPDVCTMTIADADGVRTVPHRRASPKRRIRLCWTSGVRHGLDLHAPAADLVLTFDSEIERDRFARSIG